MPQHTDISPERARKLLRDANELLRAGESKERVFSAISRATGGQFQDTSGLARHAVQFEGGAPAEAEVRQAERGTSGLSDFLRLAGQVATFETADELAGLAVGSREEIPEDDSTRELRARRGLPTTEVVPDPEVLAGSRQRVSDIRETVPLSAELAATGVGILPQLLGGIGAGGRFVQAAGSPLGRLGRSVLSGALGGGAEGAAVGAGAAEEGERLAGAQRGGLIGALLGGVAGGGLGTLAEIPGGIRRAVSGVAPGARGETRRAVQDILRITGLDPETFARRLSRREEIVPGSQPVIADLTDDLRSIAVEASRESARAGTRAEGAIVQRVIQRADSDAFRAAKDAVWEPLESRNPLVQSEGIRRLLSENDVAADIARSINRKLVTGDRAPTFRQLQSIRQRLEKRLQREGTDPLVFDEVKPVKEALDQLMEDAVPGFAEARKATRQISSVQEDLQRTAQRLQSPEAQAPNVIASEASEGGFLGVLGKLLNAFRDAQGVQTESAEEMARILLGGQEGVELMRQVTQEFPFRAGRFLEEVAEPAGRTGVPAAGILGGQTGAVQSQPDSLFQP